ncbi:endonuclease/exonuclease/phosphatase family protein [Sulfuriroseicoccus oceanibius]|uniref:Endonuclease/exonuclease/phosphatase family protein n=1 Tax=Sulfuriroseicoccus oceanibius TaxID=2707525 RepID=A0A6B3L8T3_9BACT|nr:endonuclease/exonuclease/phosphatase family protein [Sulfuriroseicoccus oceanibius]QQL44199.1 endonuclease/exonuclease/phosphatase family protein [Sulfuriroseicoccus oceanibius]
MIQLGRIVSLVSLLWLTLATMATASEVRFLAYNVKNYLTMERTAENGTVTAQPKPESEITALVEVIASSKPDIIGLCEIGTENDLADLQSRLKAAGIELPHRLLLDAPDPHRHLALLSSFPIVPHLLDPVPTFPIGATRMPINRGILDATVTIRPDFELRLMGVHLKSKREVPQFDQEEIRNQEAFVVRNHVIRSLNAAPKTRLILFGDFNDTKQSTAVHMIRDAGNPEHLLSDVRLQDSRGHVWTHFWAHNELYSRLDYVFVSRQLRPFVVMDQSRVIDHPATAEASDHRPLLIVIKSEAR